MTKDYNNYKIINSETSDISQSELYNFLVLLDKEFIPPLSLRTNLVAYAEKIKKKQ